MTTTSFIRDVLPLFREVDIQHMKEVADLDLSDYQQVRDASSEILNRVKRTGSGRMPPPPDAAWRAGQITLFETWIAEGFPH